MARKRIGPQLVVRVIDASDLVDNGGEYLLSGNVAVPIAIEDNVISAVGGPIHDAVYVVTDSEITSGKYRIQGGAAQAVVDSGNFVSPPRKVGGGRDVTPVYIVSGSFAEEEIVVPTYSEKVLAIQPASLIAYWPMNETSGTNAANLEGTAARDGTFARNVTTMTTIEGIGDGNTAPVFNGTNDVVDIYSASLNTAFNGAAGTILQWAKVAGIGTWGDAAYRRTIRLSVDSSNYTLLLKHGSADPTYFYTEYRSGGVNEVILYDVLSNVTWMCAITTWDRAAGADGEFKYYFDGSQVGVTQTALGTWAGNLNVNNTVIGASNNAPADVWDGSICHCAVWDTALTMTHAAALAEV